MHPEAIELQVNIIENLEAMLDKGQDSALLRYSIGNEYLKAANPVRASEHLAEAVRQDPKYSAAWKLYGKALAADNRPDEAISAFEQGIAAAQENGDIQAVKEMRVFLKRIRKTDTEPSQTPAGTRGGTN